MGLFTRPLFALFRSLKRKVDQVIEIQIKLTEIDPTRRFQGKAYGSNAFEV